VNIFYTAPTAIRALMREGESWVKKHELTSLRVLGTVGEPLILKHGCGITPMWERRNSHSGYLVADRTGGILITPLPGAMTLKPGSRPGRSPGWFPWY